MSPQSFCFSPAQLINQSVNVTTADSTLDDLKAIFNTLQIVFCAVGIGGNFLNILTLRSPSLQSVPFMYIRAMAIFDLIGLALVALHSFLVRAKVLYYKQMFYWTYVDASAINTFLVTSFYCALLLTIERFILITYPHMPRPPNPRKWAQIKIAILFMICIVVHLPMALQNRLVFNVAKNEWERKNNVELLCKEPMFTIYNGYKIFREAIRIACVFAMVVLNSVITRKLQIAKRNRRRLILRGGGKIPCRAVSGIRLNSHDFLDQEKARRENNSLMKSFTEKKLTALLIAICIIFIIGNIPQVFVMILQHENREWNYSFQLFRNIANALEVLNHCLNFYVFCLASRDYTRAFLHNTKFLRHLFMKIPFCVRYLQQQRSSDTVDMTAKTSVCPITTTGVEEDILIENQTAGLTKMVPKENEMAVVTKSITRTTFSISNPELVSESQDSDEDSIFV